VTIKLHALCDGTLYSWKVRPNFTEKILASPHSSQLFVICVVLLLFVFYFISVTGRGFDSRWFH